MVAARRLFDAGHEVVLFEARDRIGGHTATVDVTLADGVDYAGDTGFIVFNERTYPGLCALLKELGVPWRTSDMSFSARASMRRTSSTTAPARGRCSPRSETCSARASGTCTSTARSCASTASHPS